MWNFHIKLQSFLFIKQQLYIFVMVLSILGGYCGTFQNNIFHCVSDFDKCSLKFQTAAFRQAEVRQYISIHFYKVYFENERHFSSIYCQYRKL